MACKNWLLGQFDHVPEALFGQMAHIDKHAERLRPLKKAPARFCQALVRAAGRGKAVREIPHERDHPHAGFICVFQKPFVLAHSLCALNGEKRSAFSRLHGSLRLGYRAAECDFILVFAQLRVKIVQRAGENLRSWQLCLDPGGAEREKLRPAAKPLRPCE